MHDKLKMTHLERELFATNCAKAYARLEQGAIDEIDAAVFSGDMFMNRYNREDFIQMMERWTRQLKVWEELENENS